MLGNTYRIHFLDKTFQIPTEKIYIWISYSIGILLALFFDFESFTRYTLMNLIENSKPILSNMSDAFSVFKKLLWQLDNEFIFVFIALMASYAIVPKSFLSVVTAINGCHTALYANAAFVFNQEISFITKIIAIAFKISYSAVFINYTIILVNTISIFNDNANKNELSLIFSSQTGTRLYSALTACGSMILLNLLKILLLSLISIL